MRSAINRTIAARLDDVKKRYAKQLSEAQRGMKTALETEALAAEDAEKKKWKVVQLMDRKSDQGVGPTRNSTRQPMHVLMR